MKTFLDLQYITNLSLFKEVRTPYFFQCMYNSFWFQPFWSCSHWISVCSFQTVSTGDLTQGQKTPHDHQPMAIFQSALLPPPPTLPAPCSPIFFPCREGRGRRESERERERERDQTTHTDPGLHPQPPVPPPSVHVPLPATPQQQGPEPLPRSQSITGERESGRRREEVKAENGWVKVKGGEERERGGRKEKKGKREEMRKSEREMPWNLIIERVVSGRGGEQIKLA